MLTSQPARSLTHTTLRDSLRDSHQRSLTSQSQSHLGFSSDARRVGKHKRPAPISTHSRYPSSNRNDNPCTRASGFLIAHAQYGSGKMFSSPGLITSVTHDTGGHRPPCKWMKLIKENHLLRTRAEGTMAKTCSVKSCREGAVPMLASKEVSCRLFTARSNYTSLASECCARFDALSYKPPVPDAAFEWAPAGGPHCVCLTGRNNNPRRCSRQLQACLGCIPHWTAVGIAVPNSAHPGYKASDESSQTPGRLASRAAKHLRPTTSASLSGSVPAVTNRHGYRMRHHKTVAAQSP